jgi:hypothetical protein
MKFYVSLFAVSVIKCVNYAARLIFEYQDYIFEHWPLFPSFASILDTRLKFWQCYILWSEFLSVAPPGARKWDVPWKLGCCLPGNCKKKILRKSNYSENKNTFVSVYIDLKFKNGRMCSTYLGHIRGKNISETRIK